MASESVAAEALDARIRTLASDMRTLTGDLKIDAMAALLTAMLERQALIESGMRAMRDGMTQRMAGRSGDVPAATAQGADRPGMMMQRREGMPRLMERQAAPVVPADPAPEEMCAPES
jgi:hypothetical protein